MNQINSFARIVVTAGLLVLTTGGVVGCSGWGDYKPSDREADLARLPDPNQPNMQRVIAASLQYVLSRYRQGGEEQPIAVNLPPGMRQSNYIMVAKQAGKNVHPLTEEIANTGSMPIYHVGAIELRGNSANVCIFRPTTEIAPDPTTGKPVYQMIRVKLEGGFQPWRGLISNSYAPGMETPPQYYALPATDDPFHFENWKRAQREIALAKDRADLDARIEKMPTGSTATLPPPAPAKDTDAKEAATQADGQPTPGAPQ
jgi:hypothetical protein